MKLIIVRHAESTSNSQDIVLSEANGGVRLSARGKRQAETLARRLAKEKISRVFCSNLNRTRETCEAIIQYHNCAVEFWDELREIDAGKLCGIDMEKVERRYPDAFGRAFANPKVKVAGGECLLDVKKRLGQVTKKLLTAKDNETVLIVAHNVVNRVLIATLIGLQLKKCRAIKQKNCAITIIDLATKPPQIYTLDNSIHKIK